MEVKGYIKKKITFNAIFKYFYFSGQNCIVIVSAANLKLNENDLKAAEVVIKSAKVLVTQMEILPTTALAALKIAKKHGGKYQMINRKLFFLCIFNIFITEFIILFAPLLVHDQFII